MKIRNKICMGLACLSILASVSAKANKFGIHGENNAKDTLNTQPVIPENSTIDEVIWVVGDEPILKSDVEAMRLQAEAEGVKWSGDPDYIIPEQIAVQKLFLHQAEIDSIEVSETEISSGLDQQINRWIQMAGSREKLEEWRNQTIAQMRQQMHDEYKNTQLVQKMRQELVKDVKVTPADVRNYFRNLPEDSIPFVPTEVEVEIITKQPKITQEEVNRVKDELRGFTDRVMKGETTFATLARLYSEDPGTARQGGELGYTGRGMLDPAFASVAFNLTDPKKISKIVETEFGYHIIQLIDKRGDKVNVRHILLKPVVSAEEIGKTKARLDSIADDIRADKMTFEEAATFISDDKDTKNNHGLMAFKDMENQTLTSKFQMKDLPTEVARVVETMKVGDISPAFEMKNDKGKTVCAIVKLKNRIEGHRATLTDDYQVMKNVVVAKEREKLLHDWVVDKIKHTYIRMKDRYKNGKYEYQGWVK
ncbi:PPIC-type PPIASE domain protein [Hoylesella oralis ATCC 33269]|uniref:PPIC-type PPIASE domain protein n=1 Tax=Hoylesella oralis ATCC 33269 TaxID=873533 RepID=E7RLR5_9BACT|nr:peptidylprolyl isomerase [Hoylesella oralis]EFZ37696.1 PPIC-type PPIASE domain protein [Hoylesella oralis ATCC 33269]